MNAHALFAAIDGGDVDALTGFLEEDVLVALGNLDPIRGAQAFATLYAEVMGSLQAIRHELHDVWTAAEDDAVRIVRMTVHYTRADGEVVSLPCCNVFRVRDDRVAEYRVFMDMTPVFA